MKFAAISRRVLGAVCVVAAAFTAAPSFAVSPNIVISQVYGGGGNAGATLRNDYVELFNRGTAAVNVAGWSIQYAATSGSRLAAGIAPGIRPRPSNHRSVCASDTRTR